MTGEELGNEIREGFGKLGEAFKIAGARKEAEDIAKQGYVEFKKTEAVSAFHANPDHVDWTCKFVDGVYRFYPPAHKINKILALLNENPQEKKEDNIETNDVVEIYKKAIGDKTKITFVSINVENGGVCHYQLIATDRRTGDQSVLQDFRMNFDGQFSKEVLPSIYNQLMGGEPTTEQEKGAEAQKTIFMQSLDTTRVLGISNLNQQQLELIKNMREYVENLNLQHEQKRSK